MEDDLKLNERKLYEKVYLEMNIPHIQEIQRKGLEHDFLNLLKLALFNDKKHVEFNNVYGSRIIHLGCRNQRIALHVDGELIYKKG